MVTAHLAADRLAHNPPMDDALHELLTVDDVALLLKVSKSWVYEHTRSRAIPRTERLPHVRIGKYVRFNARHVQEFLSRRTRIA